MNGLLSLEIHLNLFIRIHLNVLEISLFGFTKIIYFSQYTIDYFSGKRLFSVRMRPRIYHNT